MTELKDQPPPQQQPQQTTPAPPQDPLSRLHRMSTTAGITSQDYVAINIPSVIATLLGFASVLAKLDLILLIIPAAGIAVGLVALSQINRSNGTQTGKGFALTGLLLSLVIGGSLVGMALYERLSAKPDERVMVDKMLEVGKKLQDRDYAGAYAMFNDRFKSRIKQDAFEARFRSIEKDVGTIQNFEWNQVTPVIQADPDAQVEVGYVFAKVSLGSTGAGRWAFTFRNAGSGWTIDDLPSIFPPESKRSSHPQQ